MMKMSRELDENVRNIVQHQMRNTIITIITDAIDSDVAKQVEISVKVSPFSLNHQAQYIERVGIYALA